mmetsp:Transcript_17338/g.48308  ORF Transcript_17338/g.48308 Transcript_17338/m.48308 type:complete len:187 (+) Transcript_17338:196-756(+)|eukprot:CAMPEP_0117675904 /NCGR_PEP_ID=MMETSP0804-20121206/15865_1 /TAXON_ID=1074897 /ORGANISM="Tetraselmis astigmatica, Strain CCMP880" /LENGTH=186 /DNA_ID=CAMNT_0005484961 /DNA_START=148 /DNA_END=708 /DNA_ORIENTATION=+
MDYPPSDDGSDASFDEAALVTEVREYSETVAQDPSMLIGHLKMEAGDIPDERAASVLVKAIIDVSEEADSDLATQISEQSDNLQFFTQTYAKSSTDKSNAEALLLIAFEQLLAESPSRLKEANAVFTALYDEEIVTDEDVIIKWCTDLESASCLDVGKHAAKKIRAAASEFAERFVDTDTEDDAED